MREYNVIYKEKGTDLIMFTTTVFAHSLEDAIEFVTCTNKYNKVSLKMLHYDIEVQEKK